MEILNTIAITLAKVFMMFFYILMYPFVKFRVKKRRYCPPIKNKILFCTATELSKRIRRKELSAEEVISAFIARCKEVNPILNAIVEDRFEAALEEAREIDLFLKNTTLSEEEIERDTPLLGLPITIKQSIAVKGLSYAIGVVSEKDRKAIDDADVVKKIRKAGGIPILISNTPELCMFWESENNITGMTLNPYDTRKTPGGSSGGEAALLSSGASLLSLASDVAGSARFPAMFCGVFGHKPSPNWVSCVGHRPCSTDENWNSVFTISPMARYAVDLPLLLKVMCQNKEYKERLNQKIDLQKIKIFYMDYTDDSQFSPSINPEIVLGINQVVKHMILTHGNSVQKVKLGDYKTLLMMSMIFLLELKNVETVYNLGDGEKPWEGFHSIFLQRLCGLSSHTWPVITHAILTKLSNLLPRFYKNHMGRELAKFREKFKEMLGNDGVLIYPTYSSCAYDHYETHYKMLGFYHLFLVNALFLPATHCTMKLNIHGLPIGLQVIANNDCDHLNLAMAREIEKIWGGWKEPPS